MKKIDFKDIILFEDDNFIVINKPPGMASLDERYMSQTVKGLAQEYFADARPVHRLDKDTSGILLLAKSDEAYRHASIQFEKRQTEKRYLAVVNGRHEFDESFIDLPIYATAKGKAVLDHQTGKQSLTIANTVKVYRHHTLVECWPITGRLHQIRFHLSQEGAPLVGDGLYGGEDIFLSSLKPKFKLGKEKEERPIIQRFALHAFSLGFFPMESEEKIVIEAPYPKDFGVLIKQLEKFG